jgi:PAS domain S-box-containing protein
MVTAVAHSTGRWMAGVVALAVGYYLTGRLGLSLAIPPGYATAVWPPSGIALAGLLLLGFRAWPAVFIGSFLVNIGTAFDGSSPRTIAVSVLVAAGLAAGASIEAMVGALLVRRFGRFPNPLATAREVFSLMVLGGPLACLAATTVGVTTLFVAGIIDAPNIAYSWATWWTGDSIGVFVFTPLVLVWTMGPGEEWRSRRAAVSIPLLFTFTLSFVMVFYASSWERDRLWLTFSNQASIIAGIIDDKITDDVEVLHAIQSFYDSSEEVREDEFGTFVNGLRRSFQGIIRLSWNERVTEANRPLVETELSRQAGRPIEISELESDGKRIPAGHRSEYVVTRFIEPQTAERSDFGLDISTVRDRTVQLNRARSSGQAVATGRIAQPVQGAGGTRVYAFRVFYPVYYRGSPRDTAEQRRDNLRGYASGLFRADLAVEAALSSTEARGIDVALIDRSAPVGERTLISSRLPGGNTDDDHLAPSPTGLLWTATLEVGGRQWELRLIPTQEYLALYLPGNGWLILTAGLLFTSLVGAFSMVVTGRNVTFARLVEERTHDLRDSETRMRTIVESVVDGIVTIDAYGIVESCNAAAERIFGISSRALAGRSIKEFATQSHHEELDSFFVIYRRTGGTQALPRLHELEGRRWDGSVFPLEIGLSEVELLGQHKFIAIIRDITERKQVERMKMEFVSTVSHELRTPLTSIRGSLGLLAGGTLGPLPPMVSNMVNLAHKNTARLIKLVNDILDMERLQSDGLEFAEEDIPIPDLIRAAVEENRGYVAELSVNLAVRGDIPEAVVRGDSTRLAQALANLISNAAKFSPRNDTVEIRVNREDYLVRISVADHGDGIPEEAQSTIFDRFTQADSSDTRKRGGTGLGLHITKTIIERHGGQISFESRTGKGTVFNIDLPVVVDDAEEIAEKDKVQA